MHTVVYALILVASSQLLSEPLGVRADPRELFQRSAEAITRKDIAAATPLLEELTREHGDSPLAEIAAFHLAECYLLQSRSESALTLLSQWSEQIQRSPSVEQIEPGVKSRTTQLLTRVLENLPNEPRTFELLEAMLVEPNEADSEVLSDRCSIAVAQELSQRYERTQNYAAAEHWLRRVVDANIVDASTNEANTSTIDLAHRLHCDLPLAWAEHAISHNQPTVAIEVLQSALAQGQTNDRELSLRFLLAEAFFAAGKPTQAQEQFLWLTAQAAQFESPPPWLASVTLRRAELLVRARAMTEAVELLRQAKSEHADFEFAYEFDYLLARCALARIDFADAARLLQQVIDAPAAADKEAFARASWMLGEVHFLQRNYPQAVKAYAQVAQLDTFPQWQARALLQSAKCHELQGDGRAAIADYKRAAELSQQPEIAQTAAQRMAVIESALPNLK